MAPLPSIAVLLRRRVAGPENGPAALVDMLAGRNTGKVLVKVAADAPD